MKVDHHFLCISLCVFVLVSKADSYRFTSFFSNLFEEEKVPSTHHEKDLSTAGIFLHQSPKLPYAQAPPLQPPKRALAAAAWFMFIRFFDASEIPLTRGLGVSITIFEGFHSSQVVQEFFHRKSSHESMWGVFSPRKVTGSIPAQKLPFTNLT